VLYHASLDISTVARGGPAIRTLES